MESEWWEEDLRLRCRSYERLAPIIGFPLQPGGESSFSSGGGMYGKPEKRVARDGSISFSMRIEIPRDPRTGKRRQMRITAPTEKELKRKATDELKSIHDGGFVDKDLRTVGSFLLEWLEVSLEPRTRPSTGE